jgi:hypothetical protein
VKKWANLSADEKKVFAREMEVYTTLTEHADFFELVMDGKLFLFAALFRVLTTSRRTPHFVSGGLNAPPEFIGLRHLRALDLAKIERR